MEKSLAIRIVSILFFVLFGVSALLGVVFMVNLDENMLIVWAYALSILALGSVLVFGLMNMVRNKKNLITSLLVIAGFGVLLGISYALAGSGIPLDAAGKPFETITEVGSKWSGAVLYLLYVLLGLSFLSLIYTEIRGAFK